MSGLGSLGIGGSSSLSSNLSALAPPFSVDRSVPKTNSNPPIVNFNEPSYVAPFNSAPHNWINSGANNFPDHNSEVDSMPPPLLPSPNAYPYLGSHSINSPSTQLPSLNPFVTTKPSKPDAIYYGNNSNSQGAGGNGISRKTPGPPEAKSYHSPYASLGIHDVFSGVHSEPNFKLLGGSSIPHLKGSSQADGAKNLSGLEYMAQWGGYWNGLADGMQGKQVEVDDALCTNAKGVTGSFVYDNYMKLGAGVAEGSSIYYDAFMESLKENERAEKPLVLDSYPSYIPLNMPKLSPHEPVPVLPDLHHQDPSPESFTNFWSHQKPHVISSHGIGSKQVDSCVDDTSADNFSTVGPYTIASGSSPSTAISYGKGSTVGNYITNRDNCFGVIKSCNTVVFQDKQSFVGKEVSSNTSQFSNHMKGLDILVESPAAVDGVDWSATQNIAKNSLDHLLKEYPPLNISPVNCPITFSSPPNETESNNVENTSEGFDHFNHAVDSPCWKGASASNFFAFEVSKVDSSELCVKNKGICTNSPNVSSQSSNTMNCQLGCVENGCSPSPNGNSVADICSGEQRKDDSSKAVSFPAKLSSNTKVHLFDQMHEGGVECAPKYEPKSESSNQTHNVQTESKEGSLLSEIKFSSGRGVADARTIASAGFEDNSPDLALNSTENFSSAPSGEDLASKLISLLEGKSTTKVDAQMVVDVMLNLSVVLVSRCKYDGNTLDSEDCEVLQHVIDNLGTCIRKNFEQGTSTREFACQQNTTCSPRVLPDFPKGALCGLSAVTNVAAAAEVPGQLDDDSTPEEKKHPRVSRNRDWNSLGFLASSNQKKMDEMTQAMKKILDENFLDEEEKDPQSLLYKNLWLEAEAALCSINYKARYDRLKMEMGKSKTGKSEEDPVDVGESPSPKNSSPADMVDKLELGAKDGLNLDSVTSGFQIRKSQVDSIVMNLEDVSESAKPVDVAESSSPKGSPPCSMVDKLKLEAKDGLNPETCTQTSTFSTLDGQVDDVESSVMGRFRILKSRMDSISPMNLEPQTLATIDYGENVTAWPFISDRSKDRILDVTTGSVFFNHHAAKNVEDHFTARSDGFGGNTVRDSHPAGDYDLPQSDWEHVLKEELVWKQ